MTRWIIVARMGDGRQEPQYGLYDDEPEAIRQAHYRRHELVGVEWLVVPVMIDLTRAVLVGEVAGPLFEGNS